MVKLVALPDESMVKSCSCALCRHIARDIFAEVIALMWVGSMNAVELEAEIARRWHEYRATFDALEKKLPPRAVRAALAPLRTKPLLDLQEWYRAAGPWEDDEEHRIAVLSGPPGTGKTVAAVWLALFYLAQEDVRFIRAQLLAEKLRKWKPWRPKELPLLIVDDLGEEIADARFRAAFSELFDRYYQGEQNLIITTNCTGDEFRERYGERVVDRLAEAGAWIEADGESLRKKAK